MEEWKKMSVSELKKLVKGRSGRIAELEVEVSILKTLIDQKVKSGEKDTPSGITESKPAPRPRPEPKTERVEVPQQSQKQEVAPRPAAPPQVQQTIQQPPQQHAQSPAPQQHVTQQPQVAVQQRPSTASAGMQRGMPRMHEFRPTIEQQPEEEMDAELRSVGQTTIGIVKKKPDDNGTISANAGELDF